VESGFNDVRKITPGASVTTVCGGSNQGAYMDGTGSGASFRSPTGIAVDPSGNLFVTDQGNNLIRKVLLPSTQVSTFVGDALRGAGEIDTGGQGGQAPQFNVPEGIVGDGSGNLYVVDYAGYTIRKITSAGVVTTLAGSSNNAGTSDGTGAAALFCYPFGICLSNGFLYVTDSVNATIRKVSTTGAVTTLAGQAQTQGSNDGTGTGAHFEMPEGIAADAAGNLYVTDANAIRKVTPGGVVTTLAGSSALKGFVDDLGAAARFNGPVGIAVDASGNVWVADTGNHALRMITPAGVVTTPIGPDGVKAFADGAIVSARLHTPYGLSFDTAGNLYITDNGGNALRMLTPAGALSTMVGDLAFGINRPGLARDGSDLPLGPTFGALSLPKGVFKRSDGMVYITASNGIMVIPMP
jgi:sugar lactone lactonase YvrE